MLPVRRLIAFVLPVLLLVTTATVAYSQMSSAQKQLASQSRLSQQDRQRAVLGRFAAHRESTTSTTSGSSGIIETIAGSAPFQTPITALKAGLGQTQGVVEDASGNLFVATGDLGTVVKIDSAGNVTPYAGLPLATGPYAASGDGGPAKTARLLFPSGLAVDAAGNLYIADRASNTVRLVSASTGLISTIAGTPNRFGYAGDGGPATNALLSSPASIALDGNGHLFIVNESFGVVREVNLGTGVITTIAGNDQSTGCNLSATQTCQAASVAMYMADGPSSVAVRQGTLYLAVGGVFEGQTNLSGLVASVGLASGVMQIVAGGGSSAGTVAGNTVIGVNLVPNAIAVDGAGNLDISDGNDDLVEQLGLGDNGFTVVAGNGIYGDTGDGGPATSAAISYPQALAFSPIGSLLLVDFPIVRSVNTAGIISTIAGDRAANLFGDGGPGPNAGIDLPRDVIADAQGNILFADSEDNVVRRVDHATGVISTVAGNGTLGEQTAPADNPGDGGPAIQAPLATPVGLALDNGNNLFILNGGQGLRSVNLGTGIISTINGSLYGIGGLAFDRGHLLYAIGLDRVQALNLTDGTITNVTGFLGSSGGDGGPAADASVYAEGVALDGTGNLYISDGLRNNIRVVNLSTGIIETFAGSASGASGYSGDGGPALSALLFAPGGLRYDGVGHLLVSDSGNAVIRQIDLSSNIITTLAGNAQLGFTGDGSAAINATLNLPEAISVDTSGNIYIADSFNDRIRRVVQNPVALVSTFASSSTSFTAGANVTFTNSFTGTTFGIAPTGAVTFFDGTTSIGTGILEAGASGAYVATLTNSTLAAGAHNITAQFAGDGNYAAVTSPAVTVTVVAPIPPSFTVTAAPASITVAQGASGTAVFTVTPAGGFNQAVTFACGSGLPTGVSCSFSPASVTPTGTAAVTSTLTVTTTGATTAGLARPAFRPQTRWWLSGGATSLACLLLFGLPSRRRTASRWLAVLICGIVIGGVAGCGSGGGSKTNPDATPPGTYTVKLTASSGSGSGAISDPVSVTLTVTN